MAYLTYGLNQGEGFIIITGDVGTGKTTLVGHLFDAVDKSKFVLAKVVTTQLDADNTLRMIAQGFGLTVEGADKAALLARIEGFLRQNAREGRRVLLVIDEAQNLPVSALEELRMLSNFQDGHKALLQTFLLGQPEFRDKLATSPELEQLRQRVIATHHLEPMQREELPAYIHHRLKLCDWDGNPDFTEDAVDAMYDFTGGVPRRLNNLASRVLLFGALEEKSVIDGAVVREVIDDLKKDNTPAGVAAGYQPIDRSQAGNMPPKVRSDLLQMAGPGIDEAALQQRLDVLERYVRAHDRSIRQIVQILASWTERGNEADPDADQKTGTDAQ